MQAMPTPHPTRVRIAAIGTTDQPTLPRSKRKNPHAVIDSVAKDASGKYEVKGKNFLASHAVHIRVVNAGTLQSNFYNGTSDASGNIDIKVDVPSLPAGTQLAFSANDERPDAGDLTGTLWSNTVTVTV